MPPKVKTSPRVDHYDEPPAACPPGFEPTTHDVGDKRVSDMLLSDVLCTGRFDHQVIPPPWPLRLPLRFALSADLQNPDRPWRSTPGSVSAAFATKRGTTWEPRAFQVRSSHIA